MAITSILVHLDVDKGATERLETAVALAQDHSARLIGLFVISELGVPSHAHVYVGSELIEAHRHAVAEEAAIAEAAFRERTNRDGIRGEWRAETGDAHRLVPLHARCTDLAVIGQMLSGGSDLLFSRLSETIILGAGRPVIVVPAARAHCTIGKHVMVAWNGTREAARAVHDALPILLKAELTTVLAVNAKDEGLLPCADIATLLAHHGVTVEVAATASSLGVMDVGGALLDWAAANSVDLIVMGAYGHSRAREWVIGGATREILDDMTVPVLMSH
jgi:nucleotide-binding universal stress UspA family protein